MAVSDEGVVLVIDNLTGTVHRVDIRDGSQRLIETDLENPRGLVEDDGAFYTASAVGLHRLDAGGSVVETRRYAQSIGGLLRLGERGFAVNPLSRRAGEAVVRWIDPAGQTRKEWGRVPSADLYDGGASVLLGMASLALCGDWIVAARRHGPMLDWFSTVGEAERATPLGVPGTAELLALFEEPDLVNPRPGYFEFPTFATDVDCNGEQAYVLLDLPSLAIARIDVSGSVVVLALDARDASELGLSDWVELVVRDAGEGEPADGYSLARNSSSGDWEVIRLALDGGREKD